MLHFFSELLSELLFVIITCDYKFLHFFFSELLSCTSFLHFFCLFMFCCIALIPHFGMHYCPGVCRCACLSVKEFCMCVCILACRTACFPTCWSVHVGMSARLYACRHDWLCVPIHLQYPTLSVYRLVCTCVCMPL